MRKAAGKVRITGQLIDAVTGAHIWADKFERDLTDVFALQDEVTLAVVSAIQPRLLQVEIALATRRRPESGVARMIRAPSFPANTRPCVAEQRRVGRQRARLGMWSAMKSAIDGGVSSRSAHACASVATRQ